MKLLRWLLLGATVYGAKKYLESDTALGGRARVQQKATAPERLPPTGEDGADSARLASIFFTREAADLAVEHLVQQHGVERAAIFVEAVGDDNSAGKQISGGDAAAVGQSDRADAPLVGSLRMTIAVGDYEEAAVKRALSEAGAKDIRPI